MLTSSSALISNTTTTTENSSPLLRLDLGGVLEDMFMVLSTKEKEVVIKRFSLNGQPRQTLEKIGRDFNVTRERVRQIEKIALNKLKRTVSNTKLQRINDLARELLTKNGGLLLETDLVSQLLQGIYNTSKIDGSIIKLSLSIDSKLEKMERTHLFYPFWRLKEVSMEEIQRMLDIAYKTLEITNSVLTASALIEKINSDLALNIPEDKTQFVSSIVRVDQRFKEIEEGIGLTTWRHVNPRSIRDKAQIILKKQAQPMHFIEIANKISEVGFDKKMVTTQAVHNELIRHEQFVLVGRGLYALKDWGYEEGTVADIISNLLRKKSPLSKQQIIKGVLKQRQVKKGTISLNLQKNDMFSRVGRAMYALAKK